MAGSADIVPASQLTFDDLLAVFNAGYENYLVPLKMTEGSFRGHLDFHDIDLEASRVAMIGSKPVAVALLGRRGDEGWVGGVGVALPNRKQGIGRQIMVALLDSARATGMSRVKLEVIVGNDAAYNLYQQLGFRTLRRLHYVGRAPAPIEGEDVRVDQVAAAEALEHYERLHITSNPWQRQHETLIKQADRLAGWTATAAGRVVAYAVTRSDMETIHWLDTAAENEGTLERLITAMHTRYPDSNAQGINVGEDETAFPVFSLLGYRPAISQYEMELAL